MDELNKKIHIVKQKIRVAINESGLALEVVELILDSIRAEVLQNELFVLNNSLINNEQIVESEVEMNGLHEDNVGE